MDDHAAKVRMQAIKAEKLKLSAMKQLESLASTLAAVADKADSDQLKTQVMNGGIRVYICRCMYTCAMFQRSSVGSQHVCLFLFSNGLSLIDFFLYRLCSWSF